MGIEITREGVPPRAESEKETGHGGEKAVSGAAGAPWESRMDVSCRRVQRGDPRAERPLLLAKGSLSRGRVRADCMEAVSGKIVQTFWADRLVVLSYPPRREGAEYRQDGGADASTHRRLVLDAIRGGDSLAIVCLQRRRGGRRAGKYRSRVTAGQAVFGSLSERPAKIAVRTEPGEIAACCALLSSGAMRDLLMGRIGLLLYENGTANVRPGKGAEGKGQPPTVREGCKKNEKKIDWRIRK